MSARVFVFLVSVSLFSFRRYAQLAAMCAFKHATNELLRSFNEQCVHLMILFQRLRKAHLLLAMKGYETLVLGVTND